MDKGGDFVWVPREPTEEMIAAGDFVLFEASQSDGTFSIDATDTYRAMLSAAPQAPETGWQGIETAPLDGSHVLLICGTAYKPEARFGWFRADGWVALMPPSQKLSGEVTKWFPTHWMPLPVPPPISEPTGES